MRFRWNDAVYIDRKVAKMRFSIWIMILVILILPLVMTFLGWLFSKIPGHADVLGSWAENHFWGYYSSYVNPNMAHETGSFLGKSYEVIVSVFGIVFVNCILVSLIVSWIEGRGRRWQEGDLHYDKLPCYMKGLKNYAIIIGGNEIVPNLAKQLLEGFKDYKSAVLNEEKKYDYVLIMTNRKVPSLRKKLKSLLGEMEEQVVIYHGERDSKEDLTRLQVAKSEAIYVIGEQLDIDQSGSHHDVKNMECVRIMAGILKEEKDKNKQSDNTIEKKLCRVMYEYQSSFTAFQFTDVTPEISDCLDFRPFNYYETWAQNVLVCPHLDLKDKQVPYLPLEGNQPITADCDDHVHLIIVGMSRMGIALGIEAAHLAHYPNFVKTGKPEYRTRITFIDSIAKKEMQYLQGHFKELFAVSRWRYQEVGGDYIYYNESGHLSCDVKNNDKTWKDPMKDKESHSPYKAEDDYDLGEPLVDVDWEFIQGDLEDPKVQCYIRDAAKQENVRLTIALCLSRDNASFAGSLYLPDEVYDPASNVVQVLAYQPYGDAMCNSFKNRVEITGATGSGCHVNFNQFEKLKAFGMIDRCYNLQNQNRMEYVADQLWRQYDETDQGRIGGRNELRKKMNNGNVLKAGKSLAAKQWSNTYAAMHLWTKLRSVEWSEEKDELDNPSLKLLAELEHIRWNTEQLLLGFAPLRPQEQAEMMKKQAEANKCTVPTDELMQSASMLKLDKAQFPKLSAWLDAWRPFDEKKEILKANMSHLDICSFNVLNKVDKEALRYDEDLSKILTTIYKKIPRDD